MNSKWILFIKKSKFNIKKAYLYNKAYDKIKELNFFNEKFYRETYPHLATVKMDLLIHYLFYGYKECKNPSEKFDNDFYLNNYPDVKKSGMNPLVHYVLYGENENRFINKFECIQDKFKDGWRISIKIPAPKGATYWGDYFFAVAMKKEFEKRHIPSSIQFLDDWYDGEDNDSDIVIVLRGLSKYNPRPEKFNIMWNISHPNSITLEEYEEYDLVFISFEEYAKEIKEKINVPVEPLLQCTDSELFYPSYSKKYDYDLLFVGSSRKILRPIIKDLLSTKYDFAVYGGMWEHLIDEKYIKGTFIENNKLNKAYSSSKILFNDHWEDMRQKNFISNRIFDMLACEAFIISDNMPAANTLLKDTIVTYTSPTELKKIISYYLQYPEERRKKATKGRKLVINNHTFKHRINQIITTINNIQLE